MVQIISANGLNDIQLELQNKNNEGLKNIDDNQVSQQSVCGLTKDITSKTPVEQHAKMICLICTEYGGAND